MKSIKVKSLPFKDVIREISESLDTDFAEQCEEYTVNIPHSFGEGTIRGINFKNGFGIIIYDCTLIEDTEIRFTKNDIHPVKYIYTAEGQLTHRFFNEDTVHTLEKYGCAIVASQDHNGHILKFKSNLHTHILSLEIDRKQFFAEMKCELSQLNHKLKTLFLDTNASTGFYHEGYYTVAFQQLISSLKDHENEMMVRKLFLEGKALEIFIKQIGLFEDDLKIGSERKLLRQGELQKIRETASYIKENLNDVLRIEDLSRQSGLNPNKLQAGFRFLFDTTVNEFIMQQRMQKASVLIKSTDLNAGQIAETIGITSKSYFSKTFKKHFGVLPSEYEKRS